MYLPEHPIDRFTDGVLARLDNAPSRATGDTMRTTTKPAAHTPGPWKLWHSGYANAPFVVHVGDVAPDYNRRYPLEGVDLIAEIRDDESPDHPSYEANARLIAAAPEMLEALQELVDNINWQTVPASEEEFDAMLARAEAAISKARGEQC